VSVNFKSGELQNLSTRLSHARKIMILNDKNSSQPEIKECLDRKWTKYFKNKMLKLGLDAYQSPTHTNRLHHNLRELLSILGNRHDSSSLSIKAIRSKQAQKP
jgi:hypothetical protein